MTASGISRRYLWISILALVLIGGMLFLVAPTTHRINRGSTWGYGPDGYGAWYAYMQEQGASIQRWQRPISDLLEQVKQSPANAPETLLQVMPGAVDSEQLLWQQPWLQAWLEQGNHLIILAQQGPVTGAAFTTQLESAMGAVTIETRRRFKRQTAEPLLADDYGAVVWRRPSETGSLVLSTTPFLAVNAYLNAPGNFAFLADLVQQAGGSIWVDEYLHGYKDHDVVVEEVAGNWLSYLAKTPLLVVVVQGMVVLMIALIAQNRRPGPKQTVKSPQIDDSAAYIQALASVLHKAKSHDFLVETLSRAEQKALQRALGLGDTTSVSLDTLKTAWQQATGRSVAELNVLQAAPRSDAALHHWLQRLQSLHTLANQRKSTYE